MNPKLTMATPNGQPTNNQRKRDRTFKTKEIDTTGKRWVRDLTKPGNAMVLRKIEQI